jgi:hypothetical protein
MKLWPSPPPPPKVWKTDAADVQCPRCGALGPTVSVLRRDRTTGELLRPSSPLQTTRILAIWLTLTLVLTVATTAVLGTGSLGLGSLLATTLLIAYMACYNWQAVKHEANSDPVHDYKCRRCLHEWQWVVGHAVPRYRETREVWADYRSMLKDDEGQSETPSP